MQDFRCPLCKQQVSQKLYDEITGLWKEKEKQLKALNLREKQLEKRAANITKRFDEERKRMKANQEEYLSKEKERQQKQQKTFLKKLNAQAELAKKERIKFEANFDKELGRRTIALLREERNKQRDKQTELKSRLEKSLAENIANAKARYEKAEKVFERVKAKNKEINEKLVAQYKSQDARTQKQLEIRQRRIDRLEEQVKKGQTPQMLGLLDEKVFLEKLRMSYPNDQYEHTGKGGDIVHTVMDRSKEAGKIVYELKNVNTFLGGHITQTQEAKTQRQADYGILVTNAKRSKDDSGFSVARGVIIIHPAGALVLISILRGNLLEISKLKLSSEERDKTIKAVMAYIQGPKFKNGVNDIVQDTIDLDNSLRKEVVDHMKTWTVRLEKYRDIQSNANQINANVVKLLVTGDKQQTIQGPTVIGPILLPEKID